MATKKYTVKASADNAVKASFADDLKNAKETYNADFKQGPYAAAKNDGSIGERLDGSSTEGMGMVYLKDKNGNISAVGSEETYDFAKKMVDKFNKQWHDDMADAVWELQHGSDAVDSACGKKKSVKSSAKRKPMMNSVKSSKKSVKASSVDGDRPNSAPNSWKSSQRMAYKVTEDDTKGEKSFPTSIDDVYKVLGEMQGTWTNPTTGWTGKCEIYERDLDDDSYIFSLVFGGNESEPDDILYVPKKNKFTIYPHSGAPTFANSIDDFKRKLKKEYSYLKKVGDNVGASMKKQPAKKSVKASSMRKPMRKTIKASSMAKRRASKRVMAAYNGEDLVMYFNGKKVYQGQPGADMYDAVLKLCENDTNRLKFQEWCNQFGDPLFEEGEYGDAGETAYVFCELIYQEFNDGSDGEDGNGILNFEIFPASQEVSGATSVKASAKQYEYIPLYKVDGEWSAYADPSDTLNGSLDSILTWAKSSGCADFKDYWDSTAKIVVWDKTTGSDVREYSNKEVYDMLDKKTSGKSVNSSVKRNASKKTIKAGINEPSTEGPLCVCDYCLAGIESHEGRQVVYNVITEFDIEPDEKLVCDWCEAETTELYQITPDEVNGAKKAVKCAEEAEDKVFTVSLYYDDKFRDLAGSEEFTDLSDAESYAHEYLDEFCVAIEYPDVETLYINPDIYWDSFDGEFACTPEIAEWQNAVWRSMGINAATTDDELEPVMGDDFDEAEDMGYGFDTSGEPISESMVDELCRIANEILEKSELAKVSSWCDIDRDSFDYWCDGSAYVSEKFTITFTYTAELMTFNKFVKEDAWWKPSAEHGLGFEINVKDGEIESVTYTDKYWAGNSTPLDNAADIFDMEALEAYIGELAAPVAMDIYNGTTNI